MSEKLNPFLADVERRMARPAPKFARPINSLGYGWLVLAEALTSLRAEIDKRADERTTVAARSQLVEIAALAWRAARELGIESAVEAAAQDIPF